MSDSATLPWSPSSFLLTVVPFGVAIGIVQMSLSRRNYFPRATFLAVAAMTSTSLYFARGFSPVYSITDTWARFVFMWAIPQSVVHCLISSEELDEERRKFGKAYTPKQRNWYFAYKLTFKPRFHGTKWQVSRRISATNPKFSRRSYILKRILKVCMRVYALIYFLNPSIRFWLPDSLSVPAAEDYTPSSRVFFRKVLLLPFRSSGKEETSLLTRAAILRVHWTLERIIPDYLFYSILHDLVAIIGVGTGLDEPEEWELWGDYLKGYTVRGYWAHWHHIGVYKPLILWAGMLVGRGGSIRRYLHNFLVFMVSGAMHTFIFRLMDPLEASACGSLGAAWFYSLQPLGMFVEGLVQTTFDSVERKALYRVKGYFRWRVWLVRPVGFIWVNCWFVWLQAKTIHPETYCTFKLYEV